MPALFLQNRLRSRGAYAYAASGFNLRKYNCLDSSLCINSELNSTKIKELHLAFSDTKSFIVLNVIVIGK